MKITHSTVVAIPDDPPPGGVGEIAWNEEHVVEGAGLKAYEEYSTSGTTTGAEEVIRCNGATPFNLILTDPTIDENTAWSLQVKNTGAGAVTLIGAIDQYTSLQLQQWDSVTLVFDGAWMMF